MIMYEALAQHPRLFEPDDIPELDPTRGKELDGVFGEFGHKSWTGIAIHRRVQLIEHLWTRWRRISCTSFGGSYIA
jgi:hypothetical protein